MDLVFFLNADRNRLSLHQEDKDLNTFKINMKIKLKPFTFSKYFRDRIIHSSHLNLSGYFKFKKNVSEFLIKMYLLFFYISF